MVGCGGAACPACRLQQPKAMARQGLQRHPGEAAADVFVGRGGLTKEATPQPTKPQPLQDGYSGKPDLPPKK